MKKITFLLVALCATVFANATSISDALAAASSLADGKQTTERYSVSGKVVYASINTSYGNADFVIEDGSDLLYCWRTFDLDSAKFTAADKIAVGDSITVYGALKRYDALNFSAYPAYTSKIEMVYGYVTELNGEGGGTDPIDPDPTETAMTGFNYVDAVYFTYEEVGYWGLDLYNDYDSDNGAYVYPDLYMEVVANNSSTIAGTYEVDYAEFSTSETNTIVFASGTITVTALGTIDGDSYPEYSFEGTFQDESGNTYTVSLNKGVWAYNRDTDEDITLAIHNVEILDNIYANNGRIYTEDAARIYTITGLDVTSMNGNLEGVYIVKAGNKVAKVMVTK